MLSLNVRVNCDVALLQDSPPNELQHSREDRRVATSNLELDRAEHLRSGDGDESTSGGAGAPRHDQDAFESYRDWNEHRCSRSTAKVGASSD